jgi:hypothetical protein
VFLPALTDLAAAGNAVALDLLIDLDAPTPALLEHATAVAQAVFDRPRPQQGVFSIGTGLIRSAYLTRVVDDELRTAVARHIITEAEDHQRPEANRTEALEAIRALADRLPKGVRQELCGRCLAIAQDPGPEHPVDVHMSSGRHPLSTFRINLGFGVLESEAARTAALLADNEPERVAVANLLAPCLLADDERITYAAAHGLSYLPPDRLPIDAALLVELPGTWPRQLAAATWISRASDAPELGPRFAADPDVRVRRALASGLERLADAMPQLAHELAQSLCSDDCWSVRRLVPSSLGGDSDDRSSTG